MSILRDKDGLDRKPHDLAPDAWYYEERNGISVYFNGKLICVIPRRKLEASLKRINAARKKVKK